MIKRTIGTHVKRIREMLNDRWEVFLHEYRFKAIKFMIAVIRKVLVRIWFLIATESVSSVLKYLF